MGENSTDALYRAFHDFLKQCTVVGGEIITPIDQAKAVTEFDPTAGGHKLPIPNDPAGQEHGRPDFKRGQ